MQYAMFHDVCDYFNIYITVKFVNVWKYFYVEKWLIISSDSTCSFGCLNFYKHTFWDVIFIGPWFEMDKKVCLLTYKNY